MVGAGAHVFAVMGYVISHQQPDCDYGGTVRLNAEILATILGEPLERVQSAIDYLCAPDPISTTPEKEGRRLVKIGQFDYQVVNFAKYFAIKNEADRRQANRDRQAKHRAKKKSAQDVRDEARRRTQADKALRDNYAQEDSKGVKT